MPSFKAIKKRRRKIPPPIKKRRSIAFNLSGMAQAIAAKFKIICNRQTLKHWQKAPVPFPLADAGGRYDRNECFAWVEKYYLTKSKSGGDDSDDLFQAAARADAERKIDEAKQSRIKTEEAEGLYIFKDKAYQLAVSALRRYHGFVKEEIEKQAPSDRSEKLALLGVPAEKIAAFLEWDKTQQIALIDRIEARCEAETKEADAITL